MGKTVVVQDTDYKLLMHLCEELIRSSEPITMRAMINRINDRESTEYLLEKYPKKALVERLRYKWRKLHK